MTAPLFYVESLAIGDITLTGDDARHAGGSMRLRPGEAVTLCDGNGAVATAQVVEARDRSNMLLRVEAITVHDAPRGLTVVQAIPKGEHADLAVDLLTQTGATRIVAWQSDRTVADWRGKDQAKIERWRRVALAASKQSRRAFLAQVSGPERGLPPVAGTCFVLHESAPQSLFDQDIPSGPITVVVGPEGGLSEDEVQQFQAAGGRPVHLGDQIMRTSTAGAAACVWIRGYEKRWGS